MRLIEATNEGTSIWKEGDLYFVYTNDDGDKPVRCTSLEQARELAAGMPGASARRLLRRKAIRRRRDKTLRVAGIAVAIVLALSSYCVLCWHPDPPHGTIDHLEVPQ